MKEFLPKFFRPEQIALDDVAAVCEALGLRHAQRAYELEAQGLITARIKCGRSTRWPRHEHQAVAAARVAGCTDDAIRSLVDKLHDLRTRLIHVDNEAA